MRFETIWKILMAAMGYNFNYSIENQPNNELFELPIIHINDFHARFVQTSLSSGKCVPGTEDTCVGGIARVMTGARNIIQNKPNAIFLNAADNYQGTLWYTVHKWKAMVEFMNKLPLDATTIGNHEFDDHVPGLVPFLKFSKAPVVCANLDDSEEPTMQGLYEKSTVITRNNKKIGIIGVLTTETAILSKVDKLKFLDEVDSVNREAVKLKAKGIDIIIVLSHCGFSTDKEIAAKCPDIDVVVGGHTNTFLYTGKPPVDDFLEGEYPVVIKQQPSGRTVLVVHTASFTKWLGYLTVSFDKKGEVVKWEGNPILLDKSVPQDEQMLKDLKPWEEKIISYGSEVVGVTETSLEKKLCYNSQCILANLITDSMVEAYRDKSDNPNHWTYAAVGFTNTGSIRTDIAQGPITFGDLINVMPFDDLWNVGEITGDDLLHFLEKSASSPQHWILAHWSGIKVVYNMTKPAFSRVQSLRVRCQACAEPKYELFDRTKIYRVVALEYSWTINNDNNFTPLSIKRFDLKDTECVADYIKSITPFKYELDDRMIVVH